MSTYKLAANTLRKTYKESGLDADKVSDVLDDVKEVLKPIAIIYMLLIYQFPIPFQVLDDHADVQDVLNAASNDQFASITTPDSDLERELDELLLSDEREQAEKSERDKNLDESIERRLHDLKINGFADLSIDEQRQIIGDSVGSLDELLKIKVQEKRPQANDVP